MRPPNQRAYFPPPTEGWGNTWHTEAPSTPVAAPLEPASAQVMTPHSISVPDSHHSQGYAPPTQGSHAPSHTYPHPIPSSSTHTRPHPRSYAHTAPPTSPVLATAPSSQQARHRQGAHSQVHEHERRPRDHPQPPPPPRSHERRPASAHAPQATEDGYRQGTHAQAYDGHGRPRDQPPPAPAPRSHEWRPTPAPASGPEAAAADDGYREERYADSYTVHSPGPGDEQVRWMSTPTSDGVGGLQRRHSQSRGSSPSRGYVGHSRHGGEARGGRR
jgi:hypothetical protein